MSATDVDVIAARDQLLTMMRALQHWQVFDGSPDDAGQPKVDVDHEGRAQMYAVLYMGVGRPDEFQESLCGDPGHLILTFQVTAAGGDQNRALRAALKVRQALTGQHITMPAEQMSGRCREQLDALTARPDPGKAPVRWSVPMVYAVDLT